MRTIPGKKKKWFWQGSYGYCWNSFWWSWRSPGTNKPTKASHLLISCYLSFLLCSLFHYILGSLYHVWCLVLYSMHTYSQVCWNPCWCYAYLLPSMLNPLLMLGMLTLSMYAPLITYIVTFLVVWWLTSWPLLNHLIYDVPMHAYPKYVWSPWHLNYHLLSGMMASIMPLMYLSSSIKL